MGDSPTPWEHINRFYNVTRKPIHLLVAHHADAAAASLTLTSLLKACFILFDLHPIAEYAEVKEVVQRTSLAQDTVRVGDDPLVDEFFLLIGLGAPVALRSFFDLRRHIVVVLDSYRPFLLDNLRAADDTRLIVWGRERVHEEVDQFFRAQLEREALRARRRRRRRRRVRDARRRRGRLGAENGEEEESDLSSGGSDEDDEDDDEEDDEDEEGEATPLQSQDRIDWLHDTVPEGLERMYYTAECAGRSCALESYDLATLLGRVKEPLLWHAAVGVCDLFMRRLIDYGTYLVEMRRLHSEVSLRKGIRRGPLDDVTDESLNRHHKIASSNAMQLLNFDEDQLFLLRHDSLWGAMWHHAVPASVLGLHRVEDGEGALRQLLARCGVSARVAQQPWREVPEDVRAESLRLVHGELRALIRARGSFVRYPTQIRCVARTVGFSVEVSTFDVCTLFTALLAAVPPAMEAAAAHTHEERLREFRREQFWRAHDIIDADPNTRAFADAVREAKSLQKAIATATSALMQPGMVQSTKGLHYAQPTDPASTSTALETFGDPRRLAALAERLLFTLTVERGLGKYTREVRPVLLSCHVTKPAETDAPDSQQHQKRSEETFAVVLAHEGVNAAGLMPLQPVERWNDCVTNTEDFIVPPLRDYVRRDVVVVEGREATAHFAEMLHLRSLGINYR